MAVFIDMAGGDKHPLGECQLKVCSWCMPSTFEEWWTVATVRAGVPNTQENESMEHRRFRHLLPEPFACHFPCIGIGWYPEHPLGQCQMKVCEKCIIERFEDQWSFLTISGAVKNNEKNRRKVFRRWTENGNKMTDRDSPEAIGRKGTLKYCKEQKECGMNVPHSKNGF